MLKILLFYSVFDIKMATQLLYDSGSSDSVLCINLQGWNGVGVEGKFKREGTCVYLWLTHVDIQQKST